MEYGRLPIEYGCIGYEYGTECKLLKVRIWYDCISRYEKRANCLGLGGYEWSTTIMGTNMARNVK